MITEWAVLPEPQILPGFTNPSFAADIELENSLNGIVMVTPDGSALYRLFIDSDGAIDSEFVAPFGSVPALFPPPTPPFPVFGNCLGDLMILSAGSGILFPGGTGNPLRNYFRLRLDNDGTPGTDPNVPVGYWIKIPENTIPDMVDAQNNWIFTGDIAYAVLGQGIVMPARGGNFSRRVRVDNDGAIISE